MRLKDKVAIITGGGSGLGKEACILFAKHGATVIVADYSLAELVAEKINNTGGKAFAVNVNVADRNSVNAMVEEVINRYGQIDILINNAGIAKDKTIMKMTQEQWQDVINVNLTGVFNCTQEVVPYMVKQGKGRIVNISSVVGTSGGYGQANYSATKAGVIGLTKSLAKELGKKNINVNAVAPGFILTPMVKAMPENVLKSMEEKIPLGRLGEPIEVAYAYLYLSSDESSYVNGTVLEIDGGILF